MRILYFQSNKPIYQLAEACLCLTPKILIHKEHELYLEVGITEKLFKSEANLLKAAKSITDSFPMTLRTALVDKPEWASAIIHGKNEILLAPGKSQEYLFSLPIEHIIYCGEPSKVEERKAQHIKLVAFMKRVGLHTVSQFANLSPTAINRRFGKVGIVLHEWVLGKRSFSIPTFFNQEQICDHIELEETDSLTQLIHYMEPAFIKMEARLKSIKSKAREIKFTFHLSKNKKQVKYLKFAESTCDANTIRSLTIEFLSNIHFEESLTSTDLEITDSDLISERQLSLLDSSMSLPLKDSSSDLTTFINRLRCCFGETAVGFGELKESYLPEKSWKLSFPITEKKPKFNKTRFYSRPSLIFSPPRPFYPSQSTILIPMENISTQWWNDEDGGGYRRYFTSKTPQGEYIWVFLDLKKAQWFIHGTFD